MFMMRTTINLPGQPRPITFFGFVPKSIGGIRGELPSWDNLSAHFMRRELRQNRKHFK